MNTPYETILEVSLKSLKDNFNYLKSKINKTTKIIAVVKAYAYGHGDIAISKKLESLGVSALWVADFEEGVRLRKNDIKIPIIIANPGRKSTEQIILNKLDIVVHNFELLRTYGKLNKDVNVHIKFNTGMNRYGFEMKNIPKIIEEIKKYPNLNIKSLCSHLAASDDAKKDSITQNQFILFDKICLLFCKNIGYKIDRHILNSHGVLRFPEKKYEMVRIGIGLYGGINHTSLKQIATFKTVITEIKHIKKGEYIGYNASCISEKNIRVGIIPLGYADGLNRKLGDGKGVLLVNGKPCLIIGKISMDSCIIKLNNPNINIGDEVIVFGQTHKVEYIANKLGTIPYEIYATLNRRIKRHYSD